MLRRFESLAIAVLAAAVPGVGAAQQGSPADSTAIAQGMAPPPVVVTSTPPDFPRGRISGIVFGDVYYNAVGDPAHRYNAAGADSGKVSIDNTGRPITRDLDGLLIRRIYFQADNDLTVRVASRFRLEADSRSLTSDGKLGVAVKAAYLQVRNVWPRGDLLFGLISTPTWENAEEFWQYRSIEKTIADFRGIGTAADLGVEARGFLDREHHVGYLAMIGDGTGQKPEDNRYKKASLALPLRWGDLRVEPYLDYENAYGGEDRGTYKVFAGYEARRLAVGLELLDRVQHRPAGAQEPRGGSLFVRARPHPMLGAFARLDLWQPDHRSADRIDSQLWIAGLDWEPIRDVHVMPNVEATQYLARGDAVAPAHHDLQARVTLSWKFSKPQS